MSLTINAFQFFLIFRTKTSFPFVFVGIQKFVITTTKRLTYIIRVFIITSVLTEPTFLFTTSFELMTFTLEPQTETYTLWVVLV